MNFIKKLITALGESIINEKLKNKKVYEVIGNDIPYQDGVIDILEGNSLIDILIVSEKLIGEYEIKEFINKIKKINPYIEIVFFMKKDNEELELFLQTKGIIKIYKDNEYTLEEIINNICDIKEEKNLNDEIIRLKKLLNEKENIRKVKNNKKLSQKINNKINKKIKLNDSKIIAVSGNYNSGKSLITSLLAITYKLNGLKVLIIDFDILNKSQEKLFGVYKNLNNNVVKISENLSILTNVDKIFNSQNKITFEKVKELLEELKNEYQIILIDTSSEINLCFTKLIFNNVQKIIFLIESNLLELKKSKNLLEVYINDWNINIDKFSLLVNKVNKFSIEKEIIKEIFENINIVGEISFKDEYTNYINNCLKGYINTKQYLNIVRKI